MNQFVTFSFSFSFFFYFFTLCLSSPHSIIPFEIKVAPTSVEIVLPEEDITLNQEFGLSVLSDVNFDTITVSWDFGDGNSTTGLQVNHTYFLPGEFTIQVTASNLLGSISNSVNVTVETSRSGDFLLIFSM